MVELIDEFEGVRAVLAQCQLEDQAVTIARLVAFALLRTRIVESVEDAIADIVAELGALGPEAELVECRAGRVLVDEGELHRIVGAALDKAGERTRDVGRTIAVAVLAAGQGAIATTIVREVARRLVVLDVVFVDKTVFFLAAQFRNVVADLDREGVVQRNAVAVIVGCLDQGAEVDRGDIAEPEVVLQVKVLVGIGRAFAEVVARCIVVQLIIEAEFIRTIGIQRQREDEAIAKVGVIALPLLVAGIVEGIQNAITDVVAQLRALGGEAEALQHAAGNSLVDEREAQRLVCT